MATAVPASITQTPSQQTAGSMVRKVLNYVTGPGDSELEDVALSGLNSGVSEVNTRKWNKLYGTTTVTLAASDATYGLSADFKEPMQLLRLNSSSKRDGRIPFQPAKTMLSELPSNTADGNPTCYTVDYKARQLTLDKTPSSGYVAKYPTLQLWYYRRIADLSQDSSTSGIDPDFDWFLIWHARAEVASIRDMDKARYANSMAAKKWRALVRNDTDQMTDWGE